MTATRKTSPQAGQGSVEFVIAVPLVGLLFASMALMLALGWLQLEVSSRTQEFGVCLLEERRELWCRARYRESLAALPGRFRLRHYIRGRDRLRADLHHDLPFMNRDWSFDEPLPRF